MASAEINGGGDEWPEEEPEDEQDEDDWSEVTEDDEE